MPARPRMPPPSCIFRSTDSRTACTASPLTERPAKALARSTTCSHSLPIAAKARACAAGSVLKIVAVAISPRTRRTQAPALRSIAGKRITGLRRPPVEALEIVVARHEAVVDKGIERMAAPASVPHALIDVDRGAL